MTVLDKLVVRRALMQAWQDSQPGFTGRHEEGGFILKDANGNLQIQRWPKGAQNEIFVPPHPDGKRGNKNIVATFHTHPNTGEDFLQEPSLTDIRAVRDDPDLKTNVYEGEYVITQDKIYRIDKMGDVSVVGNTQEIFSEA